MINKPFLILRRWDVPAHLNETHKKPNLCGNRNEQALTREES